MNNYGVTLKFENHFQTNNVLALELKQPTTIVQNLEIVQDQQYLLSATHQALNSVLDLTGITPYQLVFFDEKQEFTGASFSLGTPEQLFSIQTTARFILLIPFTQALNLQSLLAFELVAATSTII
jgi:hypothetical protein